MPIPTPSALPALTLLLAAWGATALDNGLALGPPMGWSSWNAFHDNIKEADIRKTVDQMKALGLVDLGYVYFNIDGMKFGIYSDAGTMTCARYPASYKTELRDADTFASWGVDLLKYDNCFAPDPKQVSIEERYAAMRDALNNTGRPILFSMCEWGVSSPWAYGSGMGHSWRTHADISLTIEADWRGVIDNLDAMAGLARFAGPGGWNDADMLEVGAPGGRKLSLVEQQAHFALWAMVKSPLIIGADLRLLKQEELAILSAREVVAMNQDPLGVAGDLIWKQGPKEVWAAPLKGGDRAVVLFNRHLNSDPNFQTANLSVSWTLLGYPADMRAKVRDMFARKDIGIFQASFTGLVRNHGVLALRIVPYGEMRVLREEFDQWRPWHCGVVTSSQASHARLAGDYGLFVHRESTDQCRHCKLVMTDECTNVLSDASINYALAVCVGIGAAGLVFLLNPVMRILRTRLQRQSHAASR